MHVFDGFAALAGETSGIAALEHPDRLATARQPAAQQAAPPAADTERRDERKGASGQTSAGAESARAAPQLVTPARTVASAPAVLEEAPESTPARGMRIAACILLAGLLVVQLGYMFRSELASRSPALRTTLTKACTVFACSVPLPQRPDLLKIEASDVNMLDTNRPGLIQLTTTLRSYADFDVAYPALDLVLTNATEHALARRIFVPREYLGGTRDEKAGLPARAEITVALDLDTGNLNAAGFRVDLLPAPTP